MQPNQPPYKSTAAAILLSVFFGPVGLLYSTFWGGLTMCVAGLFVVRYSFIYLVALLWVMSCIWSVRAVENYNRKLWQSMQPTEK